MDLEYLQKEWIFICKLQTKLAENILNADKFKFNFNSKEFRENREISAVLDFFANDRYNYVDEDGNPSHFHKCRKEII